MKKSKSHVNWKKFCIFTFFVGLIVGAFSVVSDVLPISGRSYTVFDMIISYLAVMINSLPIWFILAMTAGYIFGRDIKKAILLGTIYTITAITFYFVIEYFSRSVPIAVSFKDHVITYVTWYAASAAGGILGGLMGYLVKKTPFALLSLLIGLILQLFVNGKSSWNDMIGIAQNVTFCLLIGAIIIYLVMVNTNTAAEKKHVKRM